MNARVIVETEPSVPATMSPSAVFLKRIPLDFAREHLVLGIGVDEEGCERLLVPNTGVPPAIVHNVGVRLGVQCRPLEADAEQLAERIDALIEERLSTDPTDTLEESDELDTLEVMAQDEHDLLRTSGRSPIAKLLSSLLLQGVRTTASDLHIQPGAHGAEVRFRVDGLLVSSRELSTDDAEAVVARVKVLAGLDVTERRVPQDGRSAVTVGGKDIDLRISTIPTAHGERLVIRLLDKRSLEFFELTKLGMPGDIQERFAACCAKPSGMVLVCGPTGSGKTTTLYSVLRRVSRPGVNIMTLEDPIEYELAGISQSQTNRKKGINFATGLRHILRQDPDIVMVGEIRDAETATTAVQASLTGHTVLSTLHTNNAPGAVTRLLDLGVEPYLLEATLTGVLSQRLMRRLCTACAGQRDECTACNAVGYKGRLGVYELLVMSQGICALARRGASTAHIQKQAVEEGMVPIRDAAQRLVDHGLTSREELLRVFGAPTDTSDTC